MSASKKSLRIFIDESGLPHKYNPSKNQIEEKYFTLVAVLIMEIDYRSYKKQIKKIGKKYFKYLKGNEIKSRDIRRSNPKGVNESEPPKYDFWLFGKDGIENYASFCDDVKNLVSSIDFKILSVTVNKETAQKLYPHKSILKTALIDLWERICIYHEVNDVKISLICFDPKESIDDEILKTSYDEFIKSGTWYVSKDVIKRNNLFKRVYSPNSKDSLGLQLADYCAHPIRHYHQSGINAFFKQVISKKLCVNVIDTKRQRTVLMALKETLSR